MTSSEEFKQAIRTGNINEAFLVAMANAPELSITTKIITASSESNPEISEAQDRDNYLSTEINLIEGKIANEIGEKLTGDRYAEIKQFHMDQVAEGYQTIQHNLITLQKMFQLMSAFQQQTPEQLSWLDIAADVSRESLPTKPQTSKLYGKTPEALTPGKTVNPNQVSQQATNQPELPSFEQEEDDEDDLVDDLLSLADLDDNSPETETPTTENPKDWSEWSEEKPEGFNLKSLNIRQAQNWQRWDGNSPGTMNSEH